MCICHCSVESAYLILDLLKQKFVELVVLSRELLQVFAEVEHLINFV